MKAGSGRIARSAGIAVGAALSFGLLPVLGVGPALGTADAGDPDLVASAPTVDPPLPFEGDTVTVQTEVTNEGDAPAGATETRIAIDATVVDDVATPALDPGESVVVAANWTAASGASGSHDVTVTADVSEKVSESAEGNNSAWTAFGVSPPPCTFPCLEDFDDGTADGFLLTGRWHVSSACDTPPTEPNYLAFNRDSDCRYGANRVLLWTDPDEGDAVWGVDLTNVTSPVELRFAHQHDTGRNDFTVFGAPREVRRFDADVVQVEISADRGASWTTLARFDGDPPIEWGTLALDVSDFAGSPVQIRWRFSSRDGSDEGNLGWFVDTAQVHAPNCGDNDDRADACVIDDLPFIHFQGTRRFTLEEDEVPACGVGGATAWFRYRHEGPSHLARVDASFGTTYRVTLAVYRDGQLIRCTSPTGFPFARTVAFGVDAGRTYEVQVGGFLGETGTLSLQVVPA